METTMSSGATSTKKHIHMDITIPQTPRFNGSANFLELSYEELYERNIKIKKEREGGKTSDQFQDEMISALKKEAGIKAIMVCFSDLEGKLHILDYNKEFLLDAYENLTFDGSSINGFTVLNQSDLRLMVDWASFTWVPADVFGAGKVLIFANVHDQDGSHYTGDFRSNLKLLTDELKKEKGMTVNLAPETEGFLLAGVNAEQNFNESEGFSLATESGYFNALPQDTLRVFIDQLAEATRSMAFENEKDHPEVAPAQFEMNYKYTDILHAADMIQIYKITARQIAKNLGLTASFLPKPVAGINGNGMHSNMSISKEGKNIFYDAKGEGNLSKDAWNFLSSVLTYGKDICLALNPSVNSYRRLDPNFEAPNEIKVSHSDRGSMIRIPLGNHKSARIEVRTVAPDANPYFAYYLIMKAGLKGMLGSEEAQKGYGNVLAQPVKKLPGSIYGAINAFKRSLFIKEVLSEENRAKYLDLKEEAANRAPADLGTRVKSGEVWYHHEVRNQVLENRF